MGRMYSVTFEEVAVTVAQDLFEIVSPSDAVVIINSVSISQSSDAGDAASEMLNILYHRGSTSGSGGGTPTPAPLNLGDAAFGGTTEVNNTTQGSEGAILRAECFNVLAGYLWQPTPEEQIHVSPSGRLIIELQEALATVKTLTGLIPICAWCKNIRDDEGYWQQVEQYIAKHSNAEFTHGMCPKCMEKYAPSESGEKK